MFNFNPFRFVSCRSNLMHQSSKKRTPNTLTHAILFIPYLNQSFFLSFRRRVFMQGIIAYRLSKNPIPHHHIIPPTLNPPFQTPSPSPTASTTPFHSHPSHPLPASPPPNSADTSSHSPHHHHRRSHNETSSAVNPAAGYNPGRAG